MLDPRHFEIIAGDAVVERLRAENAKLSDQGESLCDKQIEQARRGYCGAELVRTSRGWSLRNSSGIRGWSIIARYPSVEAAFDGARRWVRESPGLRYSFVRVAEKEKDEFFATKDAETFESLALGGRVYWSTVAGTATPYYRCAITKAPGARSRVVVSWRYHNGRATSKTLPAATAPVRLDDPSLDRLTRAVTAFDSFRDLVVASGGYRPTLRPGCPWRDLLAREYDSAQRSRGDDRRAYPERRPSSGNA